MVVGILSLQGCVEPHAEHLKRLGASVRYVRMPEDLNGIQGLILPGGESTTMIKLAKLFGLWEPLKAKAKEIPYWGICAGSILMANTVENPAQESLGVMELVVRRNAYGRQLESFTEDLEDTDIPGRAEAVFIRAPKFVSWGKNISIKGKNRGEATYLESDRHMVTAFHPELTDNSWCHEIFLQKIRSQS